jgi:hypothetical protein
MSACYHKRLSVILSVLYYLFFSGSLIVAEELQIRYAADMAHLPAGAQIAAMGDAGVVLPRRASSVIWNPASVSFAEKVEISAEIADVYHGLSRQACFALRIPHQEQVASSIVYLPFLSGNIPLFDSLPSTYEESLNDLSLRSNGTPKGYFQNNQHLMILTLGKMFSFKMPTVPGSGLPRPLNISAGLSLKGYWQTMNPKGGNYMGVGVNADLGVMASIGLDFDLSKKITNRNIILGIAVRDFLPTEIIWVHSPLGYKEKIRYSHYYGISYVDKSGDLGGNWTFALGLDKQYTTSLRLGLEAEFWNIAVFRAGLSGKIPTLGAGVHYKRYYMDYAFRFDKVDFSFFRITVGVLF